MEYHSNIRRKYNRGSPNLINYESLDCSSDTFKKMISASYPYVFEHLLSMVINIELPQYQLVYEHFG